MKFVKGFKDFDKVSEELKYHVDNGIGLDDTVFRLGSDAHSKLFEEAKEYWDKGNIVLKGKSGFMAKNLDVGKKAIYKDRDSGRTSNVKLDSPGRGGDKKFIVYRNSGRTDEKGNIIAKKIQWGDTSGLSIKNDDPGAAASFWARHQCDQKKKMDPNKPGFWACYGPSLFGKQLGLKSTQPW
jgi:hypothetical protein